MSHADDDDADVEEVEDVDDADQVSNYLADGDNSRFSREGQQLSQDLEEGIQQAMAMDAAPTPTMQEFTEEALQDIEQSKSMLTYLENGGDNRGSGRFISPAWAHFQRVKLRDGMEDELFDLDEKAYDSLMQNKFWYICNICFAMPTITLGQCLRAAHKNQITNLRKYLNKDHPEMDLTPPPPLVEHKRKSSSVSVSSSAKKVEPHPPRHCQQELL